MKLVSSLFLLLLVHAHGLPDKGDAPARPLSTFRDGPYPWLGYALFAALLAAALLYTLALVRAGREGEAILSELALLLLLAVAATPSPDPLHLLCSFLLLGVLFGHYARLLYRAGGVWLLAHLTVPLALTQATGFHSYGAWQKSLILYFLAAAVAHHHLLRRQAAGRVRRPARAGEPGRGLLSRRRKVYRLEPGRAWARRRLAPTGSSVTG
jgi:hypothetical protein